MRHETRARLNIARLSTQASVPRRGWQIGPRIRIGGSVGKIGQNIKKAVTKGVSDTGHAIGDAANNKWVKAATAAALMASGVGAPAAAAIMAAQGLGGGALKRGGNLKDALKGGATGAIEGYSAGTTGGAIRKLGSGIAKNGVKSTLQNAATGYLKNGASGALKGAIGGGGLQPTGTFSASRGGDQIVDYDDLGWPIYASDNDGGIKVPGGVGDVGDFGQAGGGGASGGGGGFFDTVKDIGGAAVRKLGSGIVNTVTGQPGGVGLGDLALGGLAGYQGIQAANASKRAGQLSDKALGLAESRWAGAAPLRNAGQARLLNPARPDLSAVYTDVSNPFAARKLRGV